MQKDLQPKPNKFSLLPIIAILFLGLQVSCTNPKKGHGKEKISIKIENSSGTGFSDAVISINDSLILQEVESLGQITVYQSEGQNPLQYEVVKTSRDGSIKELLVMGGFEKGETKDIIIEKLNSPVTTEFKKRTQAEISIKEGGKWEFIKKPNGNGQFEYQGGNFKNVEYLKVPREHTDHSFFIRYEGPGWESDKVAYRFYLDWRNAVDIFGKKVEGPVLQNVGLDGFDSYHEPSDWGMDILKVGGSLGIGSIGFWDGDNALRVAETDSIMCMISENGMLRSEITTKYYGWNVAGKKTDLESKISILAGSYLTKQDLFLSTGLENLCTGIVKHDSTEFLSSKGDGAWQYIATWGRQSLNNDMLGMAVFYKENDRIDITSDENSHVVVLKPQNQTLTYFFCAVWEEDTSHIKTLEEFTAFLNDEQKKLNSPLKVTYENE